MIIVGRYIPSTARTKLHSKLNSLVTTSYSAMLPPHPLSTDTPAPPKSDKSDWSSDIFSPENRARTISVLSTDRDNTMFKFDQFKEGSKKAAVLVPFCYDTQGRPGLLLNLRSETLSTHSGEISFPGGTFEPDDNDDPVTCALRETNEELGILKGDVDVWTTCRVFPTVSTNLGVFPVVGFIKSGPIDPDKLVINPDEVDHAFVVPLEHLCEPSNWGETSPHMKIPGRGFTIPIYKNLKDISTGLIDIPLWGLTAFITHLVLSALIPQKYKREVPYIKLMKDKAKDKGEDDLISKKNVNVEPNSKSKL